MTKAEHQPATLHRPRFSQQWNDLYYAFTRRKTAILGTILLFLIAIMAIGADFLAPHDPINQELADNLLPPFWDTELGTLNYIMGTDNFGRDLLSRVIFGARISLAVAGLSATFSMVLGVTLGMVAGYFGKWLESLLMRLVDVFLAFPLILLALSLAAILGPNLRNLVIVMGLTGWMVYARTIRAAVISLKNQEFITAAVSVGVPVHRILLRHILPNIIAPALVIFTFGFAQFIILESSLSFLGLGVPPPTPTWGRMLYDGRDYMTVAWWMITFPGVAIMLTTLSLNFIGDGLRDALDPRLRGVV
jgi:peptide/nickel transport system permease protein